MIKKNKLVQDIKTRWNSTHDMLLSIYNNQVPLKSMELDHSLTSGSIPNDEEMNTICELCTLLEPAKNLTVLLSGRHYVTITHVFPQLYSLLNYELDEFDFENSDIRALKDALADSLRVRFRYVLNDSFFAALTFLDYDYKRFEFIKVKYIYLF